MSGIREFVTTSDTCGYHSATVRRCFVSGTREFVGTTPDTCGYHSATIRRCLVSAARVYVGTAPETYGYHSATIRSHRVSRDSSGHVPSFAALAWESGLVPASKCQAKPMPDCRTLNKGTHSEKRIWTPKTNLDTNTEKK